MNVYLVMDIASRLDVAMKEAGFPSQKSLERASGVPQPTINRILKNVGKKGPEAATLKKLAAACDVAFAWLHEGIEPKRRMDHPANFSVKGLPSAEAPLEDAPQTPTLPHPAHTQWIGGEEATLLDLYRSTDTTGRNKIMRTAKTVKKTSITLLVDYQS